MVKPIRKKTFFEERGCERGLLMAYLLPNEAPDASNHRPPLTFFENQTRNRAERFPCVLTKTDLISHYLFQVDWNTHLNIPPLEPTLPNPGHRAHADNRKN